MKKRKIIKPDPSLKENLMAFGFECGKGWYPLIEETLDKIEACLKTIELEKNYPFRILQIKEKFGGLRIYCSSYYPEIEKIIDDAEAKSFKICEVCGKEGHLTYWYRWYQTLCEEHEGKFIAEREKIKKES